MLALIGIRCMQFLRPSPGYAAMLAAVRGYYNVPDRGLNIPLKVVIAQRPSDHFMPQRVLINAPALASVLQARGFVTEVSIGCFHIHP